MEAAELTRSLYDDLIRQGYRYCIIKAVVLEAVSGLLSSYTLDVFKEFPLSDYSCTSLEDAMITTVVDGGRNYTRIYVEGRHR